MSQTKTGTPPVTKGEPKRLPSGLQHKATFIGFVALFSASIAALVSLKTDPGWHVSALGTGAIFTVAASTHSLGRVRESYGASNAVSFAQRVVIAAAVVVAAFFLAQGGV